MGTTLRKEEFPELPKWPGLLVEGPKVSEGLAAQIIVRTTDFYFLNYPDNDWTRVVKEMVGLPPKVGAAEYEEFCRKYNVLGPFEYLGNARIRSSWVYGMKGWCDWDGTIRANNYNIGKWPRVSEIRKEWGVIAEAFPALTLRAQIIDREICESGGGGGWNPVVEFRVKGGKVRVVLPDPEKPLSLTPDWEFSTRMASVFPKGECKLEILTKALSLVPQS